MNKEEKGTLELQELRGRFLLEWFKGYEYKVPGQITIGDFGFGAFRKKDNIVSGYNVTPFGSYSRVKRTLEIQMEESRIEWAQRGWSWCVGKVNRVRWYTERSEHYVVVGWQLDLIMPLENEFEFKGTYC